MNMCACVGLTIGPAMGPEGGTADAVTQGQCYASGLWKSTNGS